MTNKAIWKLTILPKTFMYTPRLIQNRNMWKRRKDVKRCTATEQLASRVDLLAVASKHCSLPHDSSPWRADGEQHCSLSRCSSPWRADYSPWRVMTDFCREERFFTPKTQFSSTPIPNLIGNSTCDDSTTWTSIIHEFYGLSTLLTTNFYSMT